MVSFTANELIWGLAVYVAAGRFLELALAERNRRVSLRSGALEFGAGHYQAFFVLHTGWLCSWIAEASFRGSLAEGWHWWLWGFLAAQLLKCWAIFSLGPCWNTRIIVIPGRTVVRKGPYRFLRHPNYLAVAAELLCVPMVFGAWLTALLFGALNAVLLLGVRIPAEEDALSVLEDNTNPNLKQRHKFG